MKNLNLNSVIKKYQTLIAIVIFSGLLALIAEFRDDSGTPNESAPEADTFIPPGFVLVPIDVQNPETLDSILGSYGVVDLFVSAGDGIGRPRRVAQKIKILRAPLNPNHFAVLAPEEEAPDLVRQSGPFQVVIQNPKTNGTSFVKGKQKRKRVFVENL